MASFLAGSMLLGASLKQVDSGGRLFFLFPLEAKAGAHHFKKELVLTRRVDGLPDWRKRKEELEGGGWVMKIESNEIR
jgi:hypothetical protein